MARGRKAANQHVCNKNDPENLGTWIVKEGQDVRLDKPTTFESWQDIMSQRVIVECDKCGVAKYCSIEKLNINHFAGTNYNITPDFWDKSIIASLKNESDISTKKERIEKIAETLKIKAAKKNKTVDRVKKSISDGSAVISVSAKGKE